MPIIRRRLTPSTVYPEDLRYNEDTDTVQSRVNGQWIDNPDADPRTQTSYPPRVTSDTDCNAAQSIIAALKGQIDQILVAIDNAQTAFTIAGTILGLFRFGPYGIFISLALLIADLMIDAGQTALALALTDEAYEELECIIYCSMDGGRLVEGSLPTITAQVSADIGGLAAQVFNAMLNLAGEGGLNNLAALGTATGNCNDCGVCAECAAAVNIAEGVGTIIDNPAPGVYDIRSTNQSGNQVAQIWFGAAGTPSACCGIVSWTVLSGVVAQTDRRVCGSTTTQFNQVLTNTSLHMARWLRNSTAVQFTVRVTIAAP